MRAQDGRFARKFNQCTTFGAVLDMVTDRCAGSARQPLRTLHTAQSSPSCVPRVC
jgi:hypothetical protein